MDKIVYKDQKYFILFPLDIWYMSAVHRPISISKKIASAEIFIMPCHSKFVIFHKKMSICGKCLYVSQTLFILY